MASSPFRDDIFKGKVVLITGGATGIGFGIATNFGKHGAKVAIMGRRKEVLDKAVNSLTQNKIEAFGVSGDVREPESAQQVVNAVVEKFGRLDILVNNAAGNFMCSAEELSRNGFKTVHEIDLQGTFNMCKASLEALKKSGEGVIINISATLHYKACPFQVHAASAKAGIDSLTTTLGVEWGEYGIRVVGIAPGPISGTEGGPGGRVFGIEGFDAESSFMTQPLGRFGSVDDIGLAAVFLASKAAANITSTTLVVDGGQWHVAAFPFKLIKGMITSKKDAEKSSRSAKKQNAKL
eukprot:TRINITY_DN7077_c0_g4_i1.p1 TRINITY_DN7077_c0_g4~~TRINITY_DN7077_c0_g4_i1.p1  ORF type:complete len:294 (-),score=63.61 TRINITY_DN7077_c0_g4_i1:291-1172(-)